MKKDNLTTLKSWIYPNIIYKIGNNIEYVDIYGNVISIYVKNIANNGDSKSVIFLFSFRFFNFPSSRIATVDQGRTLTYFHGAQIASTNTYVKESKGQILVTNREGFTIELLERDFELFMLDLSEIVKMTFTDFISISRGISLYEKPLSNVIKDDLLHGETNLKGRSFTPIGKSFCAPGDKKLYQLAKVNGIDDYVCVPSKEKE